MSFELIFTEQAAANFNALKKNKAKLKQFKAVKKALAYLEINPRHPSLNTHKYSKTINGEKVFEAYAENKTPGAYRIFWHYSTDDNKEIYIDAIMPHP